MLHGRAVIPLDLVPKLVQQMRVRYRAEWALASLEDCRMEMVRLGVRQTANEVVKARTGRMSGCNQRLDQSRISTTRCSRIRRTRTRTRLDNCPLTVSEGQHTTFMIEHAHWEYVLKKS